MAAHLEQQGERVALLAMMDSRPRIRPSTADEKKIGMDDIRVLVGYNDEESIPDVVKSLWKRLPEIGEWVVKLARKYSPRSYSGDLVLFRAMKQQRETREPLSAADWKPYVEGEIEVFDIDCLHDDMEEPAQLAEIGAVLARKPNEIHTAERMDLLSQAERDLLLRKWNETQQDYPAHLCIHHLFEQQVERTPQATALVFMDHSLTYAEVNAKANRLAHHLIGLGVQPDMRVAICVERSFAMIVGVLAILKAGGAYVPLDPAYASERLRDILSDAAPSIVVADESGRKVLGEEALSQIAVVDPNTALGANYDLIRHDDGTVALSPLDSNPEVPELASHRLAYVIYTSGSTGKPKGVLIEHQGIVNLIQGRVVVFGISSSSRTIQLTSLSFDHSVSEIFSALTAGASLHLIQNDIRLDQYLLCEYLERNLITHVSLTPGFFQDAMNMRVLSTLSTLVVMGEALPAALLRALRPKVPNG
ncbi:hypothetical protein BGZ65_009905, partial [Modicella reniformis]